jgi:octopine/nopaline transport system substrate-binding protein
MNEILKLASACSRIATAGKLATFLVAASLSVSMSAHAQPAAPLKLKVASEGTFAPFTFTDSSGRLQGFDVDVATEICKRIAASCEFVVTDFPGMIPALTVGKVDVIISAMVMTQERQKTIDFVGPYARTPNGFAAAKNSAMSKLPFKGEVINLDTQPDVAKKAIDALKPLLANKNMGAQSGTINATFVKTRLDSSIKLTEYKNTQEMDLDLAAGRLDIVINSQVTLRKSLSSPLLKDYEAVGPSFMGGVFGGGYAVGLRKNEGPLKAKLEGAVNSIVADGTVKRLSEKWIGFDATPIPTPAK